MSVELFALLGLIGSSAALWAVLDDWRRPAKLATHWTRTYP